MSCPNLTNSYKNQVLKIPHVKSDISCHTLIDHSKIPVIKMLHVKSDYGYTFTNQRISLSMSQSPTPPISLTSSIIYPTDMNNNYAKYNCESELDVDICSDTTFDIIKHMGNTFNDILIIIVFLFI
jgi:hypothetical protein